MHVEKRKVGKAVKFYLASTYRDGKKVRKNRVYLGQNLSEKQVQARLERAKKDLEKKESEARKVNDPYHLDLKKNGLDEWRGFNVTVPLRVEHLAPKDWQTFTEEFTYDTNAIEGSTLAPTDVKGILEKDKWPDKPKSEISETYGVARAIQYLRKTKTHLSIPLIQDLHQIVFQNSKTFAGKIRPPGVEVVITDGRGNIVHRGAPAKEIKNRLRELVQWYKANKTRLPPLILAAVVHNQFENIHPLQDGNGRVGRLLLNNILLKNGLPPVNIEFKNRKEYYASLQTYENQHDVRPTLDLLKKEYRALKKLLKK